MRLRTPRVLQAPRVVRPAPLVGALEAEKVEGHLPLRVAVVAKELHRLVPVFLRHGRLGNLDVELVPRHRRVDYRDAAEGAGGPARLLHKRLVAVLVHSVPAAQDPALKHRIEQILLADRAVLLHAVLDALVVILELHGVAAAVGGGGAYVS